MKLIKKGKDQKEIAKRSKISFLIISRKNPEIKSNSKKFYIKKSLITLVEVSFQV